ncbi:MULTISPECIES: bifunctional adenosylcobinamide kinase/adenosylcobinamide-phosphate guanylyltransferase [Clostridium]|uniref:bifunctional adenosylcobinamide kinase/adenosylcobinamide-phosphate guanylyltransferase n=1 Tax=Clostridium TaxID=1485 RepID=UPI0002CC2F5C|nr:MULTISPECIES: bifunctional adenosylcobinamide kinase/adenosylcobinamide-phosphate guanylyltransferase [Clostridium]APF23355.1 cobinamide kinase / cobinamide phosphate guanyltransferase family protein [Clostridium butyricum]EMU52134.1 cobinamide kinase [Clostridium butyricum DKU-01]MDU2895733.1 bifunctional adenosylcobinamide kinase/adenosylcobinamide-phosphate guanylyltransferase [Clostridium sp.]MDU3008172.1 bifunctional adenosylcobinamide kinase/adenosylcobinamide-phosphate guanylyltransfe
MIFIIGGENQGKLEYLFNISRFKKEDVVDCLNVDGLKAEEILMSNRPVIYNFNNLIKELLVVYDDEEKVKEKIKKMIKENRKAVIISNEIGYGIVPIDKFERRYRELTGRICCEIAKESKEVHRVICGIGTIIKGEEND